ncbi:Crp/Fnr family transcriptional regulator [bacterium]|nr:Crp/Fnr family transcriptional regulator [bacterium]
MPLGIQLNEEFLKKFGKKVPPESILAKEGQQGDSMFIISTGKVAVLKNTSTGQNQIAVLKDGDIFGEMALMGMQPTRTATVKALTETLVLELNKAAFLQLIKKSPELAMSVIRILTERLRDTNGRVVALSHDDHNKRLSAYVNHLAVNVGRPAPEGEIGRCFVFDMTSISKALNVPLTTVQSYFTSARKACVLGVNGEWCWVPYPEYLFGFGEYLAKVNKA